MTLPKDAKLVPEDMAEVVERLARGCNCGKCKLDACCCPVMEEAATLLQAYAARERMLREENERLKQAEHRAVMANVKLGAWMSAALDDPQVCAEMKADIEEWFSAGHPPHALTAINGADHDG